MTTRIDGENLLIGDNVDNLSNSQTWTNYLSFDYDSVTHHGYSDDEDGYSQCDSMCRCITLENISVEPMTNDAMKQAIANVLAPTMAHQFAINEILKADEVFDEIVEGMDWYVFPTGGYYGEEIGGAELDDISLQRLQNALAPYQNLTLEEGFLKAATMAGRPNLLHEIAGDVWTETRVPLNRLQWEDFATAQTNAPENNSEEGLNQIVGVAQRIGSTHRLRLLDANAALRQLLAQAKAGTSTEDKVWLAVGRPFVEIATPDVA